MIKGMVLSVAIVCSTFGFAMSLHGLIFEIPSFAGTMVSLAGVVLAGAAYVIPDE